MLTWAIVFSMHGVSCRMVPAIADRGRSTRRLVTLDVWETIRLPREAKDLPNDKAAITTPNLSALADRQAGGQAMDLDKG
jgi:hypothetical protein